MSAAEIAARFAVEEETLELYRTRGTLRSTVLEDGARVFDASAVAMLFRRRGAAIAPPPDADSFGRIGTVVLGGSDLAARRQKPARAGGRPSGPLEASPGEHEAA